MLHVDRNWVRKGVRVGALTSPTFWVSSDGYGGSLRESCWRFRVLGKRDKEDNFLSGSDGADHRCSCATGSRAKSSVCPCPRVQSCSGQIVEVSVPQVAEQFVASFVAVPVPQILNETVEGGESGSAQRRLPPSSFSHVSPNMLWLCRCPLFLKVNFEVVSLVLQGGNSSERDLLMDRRSPRPTSCRAVWRTCRCASAP